MKKIIKLIGLAFIFLLPVLTKAQQQDADMYAGGDAGGNDPQQVYFDIVTSMTNEVNYFWTDRDFFFEFSLSGNGAIIAGTKAPIFYGGTVSIWNSNNVPASGRVLKITDTKGIIIDGATLDFNDAERITTDRAQGAKGSIHFFAGNITGYDGNHFVDGYISNKASSSSFVFPVGAGNEYMPVTTTGGFSNPISVAYYNSSSDGFVAVPNPNQDVTKFADGSPTGSPPFKVWQGGYWDFDGDASAVSVSVPVPESLSDESPKCALMGFDGSQWVILGTPGSPMAGEVPANIKMLGIGTSSTPLPVKLIDFHGRRMDDGNHLYWSTAEEINTDHFELEYSADGHSFTKIASIKAAGTTNARQDYNQVHDVNGIAYYRLRIIDIDGKFSYSKVIRIDDNGNSGCLTVSQIYPVPFGSTLSIKVSSCKDQQATIMLVAVNGAKVVAAQQVQLQKGEFVYTLQNLAGLSSGVYVLRVQTTDGVVVKKVMKQ